MAAEWKVPAIVSFAILVLVVFCLTMIGVVFHPNSDMLDVPDEEYLFAPESDSLYDLGGDRSHIDVGDSLTDSKQFVAPPQWPPIEENLFRGIPLKINARLPVETYGRIWRLTTSLPDEGDLPEVLEYSAADYFVGESGSWSTVPIQIDSEKKNFHYVLSSFRVTETYTRGTYYGTPWSPDRTTLYLIYTLYEFDATALVIGSSTSTSNLYTDR